MTKNAPVILQVIPTLQTGGAEQTTLDIGDALVKLGWKSLVASQGGRMVHKLVDNGTTHIEMPLDTKNPLSIYLNAWRLRRLIKREGVDLIHARSRAPAWSALIAARRAGIPFVTTYHGAYNQKGWLKGLYNSSMTRSDCIIANSHWTANLIRKRCSEAEERIVVIPRGTSFDGFSMHKIAGSRLEALRQSWGLGVEDFVFLHLARLTGWKGQRVVIDAAAKVVERYPNCRFILAGDAQGRDAYLQSLKDQITNLGLQEYVILPGHCDDPAAAVALADAVVVASIEAEAFGRAAVEAGALEKPVIVTRIGAVGETVLAAPDCAEHEATGWKVEPGNAKEMADAMMAVRSLNETERRVIGVRARIHGEGNFSLAQMCSKTLKVYRKCLEPGHNM